MQLLRSSSLTEYADWYLKREGRKPSRQHTLSSQDQLQTMRTYHDGKMRSWFTTATWSIVLLNELSDFSNLIFLESDWTKSEGLVVPHGKDYRLLKRVAQNALKTNYLLQTSDSRHKDYYNRLANGSLKLNGENRIAICSLSGERQLNPTGQFYLLDGTGRSLPYMILILEGKKEYEPVETFLAVREISPFLE